MFVSLGILPAPERAPPENRVGAESETRVRPDWKARGNTFRRPVRSATATPVLSNSWSRLRVSRAGAQAATQKIRDSDLADANTLELIAEDGGDDSHHDHAFWLKATLRRSNESTNRRRGRAARNTKRLSTLPCIYATLTPRILAPVAHPGACAIENGNVAYRQTQMDISKPAPVSAAAIPQSRRN